MGSVATAREAVVEYRGGGRTGGHGADCPGPPGIGQGGYAVRNVAWVTAALLGSAALVGCEDSPRPAAPPGSQSALGTGAATAEAGARTAEAGAVTTQAPAPSEEATTRHTSADTAAATEAATEVPLPVDEPPEMPDVAMEQTGAGAQAFAEHYLDALNWAFQTRYVPYVASLRTGDCWTCKGLEDAARAMGRQEGFVRTLDVLASTEGEVAQVDASVERPADRAAPAQLSLTLVWDGVWLVQAVEFVE